MTDDRRYFLSARHVRAMTDHGRSWRDNFYVYPVISRRARGLSIGVNLNPRRECTFQCVYCQIDRTARPRCMEVDLDILRNELEALLDQAASGALWDDPHFAAVPSELRSIHDIAFSGDGEPTAYERFAEAVQIGAAARAARGLDAVKLVVISNATRFDGEPFRSAVPTLKANNGEVWAKLDAGTAEHYRRINRGTVPLERVLANIEWVAREMGVVIQSMFLRLAGAAPDEAEVAAYIDRLRAIRAAGGRILAVQAYTVARPPADPSAKALADAELDAIAARIRTALGDVPVEAYYGAANP